MRKRKITYKNLLLIRELCRNKIIKLDILSEIDKIASTRPNNFDLQFDIINFRVERKLLNGHTAKTINKLMEWGVDIVN